MIKPYKQGSFKRGEHAVIMTQDTHDGQTRIHMSVSCQDRLPTWEEIKAFREEFLPLNRDFIMFFPNVKDYINFMPYCLHLIELKPSDRLTGFIDRSLE